MTEAPPVSIVMPCYNCKNYVEEAIESCVAQDYDNLEIVVIDDGSTDGSLDIVRACAERSDRIKFHATPNRGASAARNFGMARAGGRYLIFLDADDILEPAAVRLQVAAARGLQEHEIAVGQAVDYLQEQHVTRARPAPAERLSEMLLDIPITSSLLHRREAVVRVGGFNERMRLARDDYDLFVRLLISGYRPRFFGHVVYKYRQHGDPNRLTLLSPLSVSDSHLQMYADHVRAMLELDETPERQGLLVGTARSIWQSGRAILREGADDAASRYFALALSVGGRAAVHGRMPYRVAAMALGPIRAEKLLGGVKRAVGRNGPRK